MALEGALVVPIFLFFMVTVLLSLEMVRFQSNLCEALYQAGNHYAIQEYQVKYGNGASVELGGEVKTYLEAQPYPYLCIAQGEQGVSVENASSVSVNGIVMGKARYQMKPFIFWIPVGNITIQDSFVGHAWTGYSGNEPGAAGQEGEEYVYITKTGTKYHKSCDCTYLKITPRAAGYEELLTRRNQHGGKYYPCERCRPGTGGMVYITPEGSSYHSRSDCSALKRTVYLIPLGEASGYSPCGRCAG